jgi:hypothetical protein
VIPVAWAGGYAYGQATAAGPGGQTTGTTSTSTADLKTALMTMTGQPESVIDRVLPLFQSLAQMLFGTPTTSQPAVIP